jgi:hypothetical protein
VEHRADVALERQREEHDAAAVLLLSGHHRRRVVVAVRGQQTVMPSWSGS